MPTISGTLNIIELRENMCCLSINTGSTNSFVLLWSTTIEIPSEAQRLVQNQWLNLSRDALVNGKTIEALTVDGSALVFSLSIST